MPPTLLAALISLTPAPTDAPLRFETQIIDRAVGEVCYALVAADINGDDRTDVVAATDRAVLWYANPTWDRRVIVDGATPPDNVCLEAADLDSDGRTDLVVGAGWGPLGLRGTEQLMWIHRPRGSDAWAVHRINPVPSLHRVRIGRAGGDARPRLIAVPLQGDKVKEPDWGDGPGVQIRAYFIPRDPASDDWSFEIADQGLHTAHGAAFADLDGDGQDEVLVAAWEGVFALSRDPKGRWTRQQIGAGLQDPGPSKGASEVRLGRLANRRRYVATVEPWHGHLLAAYTPPASGQGPWDRHVIDADATGAHGLWCANLDADADHELAVARRDADHDLATKPNAMGIFVYDPIDGPELSFERHIIDDGGIAAEDLVAADLDGDYRTDLVAGGRETHDVRIYWNRTTSP